MDLGTAFIDTLIVYDVPVRRADGPGDPVVLSGVPSALDGALRNFFKQRIIRPPGRPAFEVEPDAGRREFVAGALKRGLLACRVGLPFGIRSLAITRKETH
jgi:hypothetical protein